MGRTDGRTEKTKLIVAFSQFCKRTKKYILLYLHTAVFTYCCIYILLYLHTAIFTYCCHYLFHRYSVRHRQSASHFDPFTPGGALGTYLIVGSADPTVSHHMTPCIHDFTLGVQYVYKIKK